MALGFLSGMRSRREARRFLRRSILTLDNGTTLDVEPSKAWHEKA